MYDEFLLPPGARLLHIGPPKTGTTAIQQAFHAARAKLPEYGVRYAGRGSRPRDAVHALLSDGRRAPLKAWNALAAEVAGAGDMRVCISNEQFAGADARAAARAVAELGGPQVHVVMSVRPIAALLPSQWQQRVRRSFQMIGYDDWLREVLEGEPGQPHHDHFWSLHDLPRQLERWGSAAAPERVTVLVPDESDREFLPRIFEGLLGLPEGLLVAPADRSNRSLDLAEAELLRSLDAMAAEQGWPKARYVAEIKEPISKRVRSLPRQTTYPILLPAWARDRVVELEHLRADTLRASAVRIIGEPDSLRDTDPRIRPADERELALPVATTAAVVGQIVRSQLGRDGR